MFGHVFLFRLTFLVLFVVQFIVFLGAAKKKNEFVYLSRLFVKSAKHKFCFFLLENDSSAGKRKEKREMKMHFYSL